MGQLQKNLVLSHACGTGDVVPQEVVKIMLLLKAHSLSYGYSGVQLKTVERLIEMFNNEVLPLVYQQGSLGASGDLAPLAHLSLSLLGEGEVYFEGKKKKSKSVLKQLNWSPIQLQSKEGLALLNGTQFMGAYGVLSLIKAQKLSYLADMIGSISLEAFDGRSECFDILLHQVRPHKGQLKSAANYLGILQLTKTEWINQRKKIKNLDQKKIEKLIDNRNKARKEKNFVEADKIRDKLTLDNIILEDSPSGTKWRINN